MLLDALTTGTSRLGADAGAAHEMSIKATQQIHPDMKILGDFDSWHMPLLLLLPHLF